MIGDVANVVERNAAGLAEGSTEAHHAESSSCKFLAWAKRKYYLLDDFLMDAFTG